MAQITLDAKALASYGYTILDDTVNIKERFGQDFKLHSVDGYQLVRDCSSHHSIVRSLLQISLTTPMLAGVQTFGDSKGRVFLLNGDRRGGFGGLIVGLCREGTTIALYPGSQNQEIPFTANAMGLFEVDEEGQRTFATHLIKREEQTLKNGGIIVFHAAMCFSIVTEPPPLFVLFGSADEISKLKAVDVISHDVKVVGALRQISTSIVKTNCRLLKPGGEEWTDEELASAVD